MRTTILVALFFLSAGFQSPVRAADEELLNAIREKWQSQSTSVSTAVISFQLDRSFEFPGLGKFTPAELIEAVKPIIGPDASMASRDAVMSRLRGKPSADIPMARFVFDGVNIREEYAGDTQVIHDGIQTVTDPLNHAVHVQDKTASRRRVLKLYDFRFLPRTTLLEKVERMTESEDSSSVVVLETTASNGDWKQYHVDRETGDVYRYLRTRGDRHLPVLQILQGDFRTLPGGGQMPFVKIEVEYDQNGAPRFIESILVESMEVNVDIPPEEFQVSAPGGAVVFDRRGLEDAPPRTFRLEADESNVVSHIDSERAAIAARWNSSGPTDGKPGKFGVWEIICLNLVVVIVILAVVAIRQRSRASHPD